MYPIEALMHQLTYTLDCLLEDDAYHAHPTLRDEAGLRLSGCNYQTATLVAAAIAEAVQCPVLDWFSNLVHDAAENGWTDDDSESFAPRIRERLFDN